MIFILLGFLFVFGFYNFYWKRKGLPPGPVPLPILGNIISLGLKPPPQAFLDWRKQYGNVYTYWLGETPHVSINDFETVNDLFIRDGETYAGRPLGNLESLELNKNGRTGIIFTDGETWRELRRFSLHTLRNFGLGKNLMQERVLDEVSHMISMIKKEECFGNLQNIQKHIDISVGSIIMQLIFGYRYSASPEKEAEFAEFKAVIDKIIKNFGTISGLILANKTHRYKYFPILGNYYRTMMGLKLKLWEMFERNIENRKKEIDLSSDADPIDYIEAFLRKKHELESKDKDNKAEVFTNDQLTGCLWDMWIAGQETTSNTLGWGCIYITNRPQIQKRIQKELDSVIGSDRLVTIEDKPRLPYINAVITEIQRLCNLVPQNVQHRVIKDVVIQGYRIPKDTVVVDQISCVLYDPEIFPNPMEFNPERHLDKKGDFKPHPAVIPFGVGKRSCLGEGLARMELFLFTANIFNLFELHSDEKHPISEERKMAGTVQPPQFVCKIVERH